jgi:hypothetical protein
MVVIKFDDGDFESGSCSSNSELSSFSREGDDHADENVSGTGAVKLFLLRRSVCSYVHIVLKEISVTVVHFVIESFSSLPYSQLLHHQHPHQLKG